MYKAYFNYEITLKDKTKLNLKSSNKFWEQISTVDDLFVSKRIQINRVPIDSTTYFQLLENYGFDASNDRDNIIAAY